MLSKWDIFLLKCFDLCGFCSERYSFNFLPKSTLYKNLLHIIWALALTFFVLMYLRQPKILDYVLPYSVNRVLQYTSGILTYWVVIVESSTKNKIQRKFWQIYEHINQCHTIHKRSVWSAYSVKLIEFFIVGTSIHIYFMYYFLSTRGNYFFFRLAYLYSVILNQYRVFYYLFYLDLIKFELNTIKIALQDIVLSNHFSASSTNQSVNRNVYVKRLQMIYKHYRYIYELSTCINHIFGWSKFATVLFCFQLPLGDGNWASFDLYKRSMGYAYGIAICINFQRELCNG